MTTSLASIDDLNLGDWPQIEGRRKPEHLSVFEGDDRLGINALKLAGRIGQPPMPWQVDNVLAILRTNEDGSWVHPSAVIICPRQNGKSEILLTICLYLLFVRKANIVFSTQQWKTARKLAIRFQAMIKARPDLKRRLACQPTLSQGQSIVTTTDAAELIFCTRSGDTGKGLDKVDLVIYDEAYNLTEAEMTGPTLAQMAAQNPQTIYTSSAVFNKIHPNGQVLAGIRRNGLRRARGLYFAEYMAPEPPADMPEHERRKLREDPAVARQANPSYGVIQTDAKVGKAVLDLCGTADGRRSFEVDVLGWGDWPVDADVLVSEIPADKWDDMGPKRGRPTLINSPAIGLHREGGIWTIVGAQYTDAGRAHLEIGYSKAATATDVVATVVELVAAWNPVAVAIKNRSDAAALKAELLKAGIEPEMIDGGVWAQWCGGFLNAAVSDKLSHSGQDALNDGAAAAVKHELPAGGFIWDESAARMAAGALCSATLAHGALLAFGNERKRKTTGPRSGVNRTENSRESTDFDVMSAAF
jgi:hypothetical protein